MDYVYIMVDELSKQFVILKIATLQNYKVYTQDHIYGFGFLQTALYGVQYNLNVSLRRCYQQLEQNMDQPGGFHGRI